jgi:dienelactone hydrolase
MCSRVKLPEDVDDLQKPGLFVLADNDRHCPETLVKQLEELLDKKTSPKCSMKFYPGEKSFTSANVTPSTTTTPCMLYSILDYGLPCIGVVALFTSETRILLMAFE